MSAPVRLLPGSSSGTTTRRQAKALLGLGQGDGWRVGFFSLGIAEDAGESGIFEQVAYLFEVVKAKHDELLAAALRPDFRFDFQHVRNRIAMPLRRQARMATPAMVSGIQNHRKF